jgi:hypothetical protein
LRAPRSPEGLENPEPKEDKSVFAPPYRLPLEPGLENALWPGERFVEDKEPGLEKALPKFDAATSVTAGSICPCVLKYGSVGAAILSKPSLFW